MEITKQLLLNLSLFLVLIFFFQIFNEKRRNMNTQKLAILLFCTIAIIISLSLSIKIGVDARFDLRSIPLIIGSLYSGIGISFFLFSITLGLRAIFGINYGFLVTMKNSSFEEEKRKEFIEISISELNRAEKIINEYLSYSKPVGKEVGLLDINLQINQLTSILEPLANMNSVVIEKNLNSTAEILGDISEIQQSFLNIMKNCIEAMPHGGILSITTMDKNDAVQIVIADTGIGMTNEQIQKLGEPYFTTKGSKGTGLGMMVTFNIIKAMYGKIVIKSKVGKGTTFIIHFPAAKLTKKPYYQQSANA